MFRMITDAVVELKAKGRENQLLVGGTLIEGQWWPAIGEEVVIHNPARPPATARVHAIDVYDIQLPRVGFILVGDEGAPLVNVGAHITSSKIAEQDPSV